MRRPRDRIARWKEFVRAWELAIDVIHRSIDSSWRPGRADAYAVLVAAGRTRQGRRLVERIMFGHGIPPHFWWRPPWYAADAEPPVWDATPAGHTPEANPLDCVYGWEIDSSGKVVRKRLTSPGQGARRG